MRDVIICLVAGLEVFDDVWVVEYEFFPEVDVFFVLYWYFRDQFSHVVDYQVFVVGMEIGVKRAIHESQMNGILNFIELLLEPLRSDLTKILRYFPLA